MASSSRAIDPRRTAVSDNQFWKWVKALSARDEALLTEIAQCQADIVILKNNLALLHKDFTSLLPAGNGKLDEHPKGSE